MKPVTLGDIGRDTGFSVATVSKALRNSVEIPAVTRDKIQLAARSLGYFPNPLLAALASKHFDSRRNVGTPVAYIHSAQMEPQNFMFALQEHGRRLGYRVEPFCVKEFSSGSQATSVLFARGFQGIILAPEFQFYMLPEMEWNHFSVVGWGAGFAASAPSSQPWLHRATVDHFRTVVRAWEETRARGYKRIGFVLFRGSETLLDDQARCGGAQFCLQGVPARARIPICFPGLVETGKFGRRLASWAGRYRPDAVIGFNGLVRLALRQENFRVPEDVGFVSLHKSISSDLLLIPDETESGMKHMEMECAFGALELLDQQIRHHQYGLPRTPKTLTIYSEWIDGDSLPQKASRKAASSS